jgi:hypothetical protein
MRLSKAHMGKTLAEIACAKCQSHHICTQVSGIDGLIPMTTSSESAFLIKRGVASAAY